LWTIPVAGTALYISDQYLTSRSIVTFAVLFSIWSAWKDRKAQWICWSVVAICVHPLMAVFGISYALLLWWMKQPHRVLSWGPIALLPPNAYRIAVATRPYFFILKWEWYEWLGALAPLVLLWRIGRLAKQHALDALATMSRALVVYGGIFLLSALALTIPDAFQNLALLQPMRSLHLLYILMFLLGGGVLGKWVLKRSAWRWVALFLPLIGLMYTVQRQLFPESPQIEWPGIRVENDWLRAFDWIRQNTPSNALFAIDPEYMIKDDQHGFRAIAERSRLADAIKDSGAVTMFPDQPAAHDWLEQVTALNGWASFREEDFHRLHNDYGVSWAVVQRSLPAKLNCPYQNQTLLVCQVN